ncbi:MAG: glutamate--tRNA ligase family protein [bacterium]|nr:glutamate--tRNA ligase family protein [bacterium]
MNNKVVTRFAPSPTGKFHVGGIRSALYNYLYAQKHGGKFILRCEDTDKERSKKEYEDYFLAVFDWLGLHYDEYYRQSERTPIYKKYLEKLIREGKAYVSKEEVKEEGQRSEVIRFKNPNIRINFHDEVLGDLSFDTTESKDFIIARDLENPLFNFANVVDDFEMGVTHVIRGQEHVSNTPRQILIGEAIGAPRLIYAHCSIILNEERAKLSKRDPLVSPAFEYKEQGYLPEAMLNFMSLLGWNPGTPQEIFSLAELVETFSLERLQKQGAIFNPEKLEWINKEHIKKLSPQELEKNILARLPENMRNPKLVPIIFERISKWGDVTEMAGAGEFDFLFKFPEFSKEKLIYKNTPPEKIKSNLELTIKVLGNISEQDFTKENIKTSLMLLADHLESRGELLHPVRFALSGLDKSPDPFVIASILGKNETLFRLQKAI